MIHFSTTTLMVNIHQSNPFLKGTRIIRSAIKISSYGTIMRSSRIKSKKGCGCSAAAAEEEEEGSTSALGAILSYFKQAAGWKYTRKAQRASQARMKSRIIEASRRQRPRSRRRTTHRRRVRKHHKRSRGRRRKSRRRRRRRNPRS